MDYTSKLVSVFKSIGREKDAISKSEIFRRIYKLPKRQITEKQKEVFEKEIKESSYFTIEQIEKMFDLWSQGLEFFVDITFIDVIDSLEKIFFQENPNFDFILSKTKQKIADPEELKIYESAKKEYNTLVSTPFESDEHLKDILEFSINVIENSFKVRQAISDTVFNGNSLRFGRFLKSKNKINFLTRKELKELEYIAEAENEDIQQFIDDLSFEYGSKDLSARKKELKLYYDFQIRQNKERNVKIEELEKIIKKFEGK